MVYQHTFKEETHMKNKKDIMMKVVRNSITKIAEKKHMQIVLDLCMSLKNPKNILNHIKKRV